MPSTQSSKFELAVQVDVAAAQADALAVDAGEIGLAADPAAVAAVERVIPHVQFPHGRRVHRRDEVAQVVRHVHDVFVGADAVHAAARCNSVARCPRHCSPQPLWAKPITAPCPCAHLKIGKSQLGHSSMTRAGVILLFQPQQADVPAVARREAGHLHVVTQQVFRRGQGCVCCVLASK